MNRLERLTRSRRTDGLKTLVPFLTAGYPDRQTFQQLVAAVARSGCRILEIGIPFSDPVADGPVIQASSQKALAEGVNLAEVLDLAGMARNDHGLEVVLMGYLNPILYFGPETFASACGKQGVAGVIVPDLPPEESGGLRSLLGQQDVTLVDLVAPTTTDQRLKTIAAQAAGFLYLVSVTGVTGSGLETGSDLSSYLARVASFSDVPRYVGFGVSNPEQAAGICQQADGVIIGSELIRIIDRAGNPEQAAAHLEDFLNAVNGTLGNIEKDAP